MKIIYKRPLIISLLVAVVALVLTQLLVYEQYRLLVSAKRQRLVRELNIVDHRFRGILLSDITAANTLAIFYKYCGLNNFDSVAQEIMSRNKNVEVLSITENGIITHVYPLKGYEKVIGINVQQDTIRQREADSALNRNEIFFAGPRAVREGGVGILGKVPIVIDGKPVAIAAVLTKLPTIVNALKLVDSNRGDYAYQLKKIGEPGDTLGYFLTAERPDKRSEVVTKEIPEGDWLLSVSYKHYSLLDFSIVSLSALGIFLSFGVGLFTYRRLAEPFVLRKIISEKTKDLTELNASLENRVAQRTHEVDKLNKDLQGNIRDLEMANKDLEAFGYSVSHDLRAPLRNIGGYISLLQHKGDIQSAESAKYFSSISGVLKRMNSLIEDLLSFSRVGKKGLETTALDMNKVLADALEGVNVLEWNSHTVVKVGTMLPANGDYILLKQVFVNLISNAVKYSRTKESPMIEIGSYRNGDEVIYFVKDNGVGFSMEYYDKLFKVFQRLHSASDFEGIGIGLAIVQRIVMKHGGRVWAEAKVGEGATFYFTLPVTGSKDASA